MLQVDYRLNIGSTANTPKSASALIDLWVSSSLAVPVNSCRLALSSPASVSVSLGDLLTVELGYGDSLTKVFTGKIRKVVWGIDQVEIEAKSSFSTLAQMRLNAFYEKSSAGEIVSNLAESRLKIKTSSVENGIKFLSYAVGDRQTIYETLKTLAERCGFDLYADTEDGLVFATYKAKKTHQLTYGDNIFAWEQIQLKPAITGVAIYGESPASHGQGEQGSSWLTKKEVKGSAGETGISTIHLADPSARTLDIANKIADFYLKRYSIKQTGVFKLIGDEKIKLGDAIKVEKMPISTLNGTFKVTAVTHRLNRHQGFQTTINWEENH